jgi:rare lipoprotein A
MNTKYSLLLILSAFIAITGCTHSVTGTTQKTIHDKGSKRPATQRPYVIGHKTYYPIPTAQGYSEKGIASWYGKPFHGRKTANGETYNMYGHTAAHKTLPMNTVLLVKNRANGKSTVVRVNDRGPFVRKRIIDLSKTAAKELGMLKNGTANVEIIALAEEIKHPAVKKRPPAGNAASKLPASPADNKKVITGSVSPPEKERQLVIQDFDKGNFYIQVGAFEHRKNARGLAKKFADKGKNVIIQQFPAAGTRLYRVMVYSGTSLKAARKYESWLEKHGYPHAYVIARDKKQGA